MASGIDSLEQWEREALEKGPDDFGRSCYNIADMKETTIPGTMKWLKMSAEQGFEKGILTYAGLLHGLNPDLQYKGDEAAWWVKRVKDEKLMEKVGSFDADGLRARRHLTRTLLSGSLSKNQDSVLYRSFFRSGLREVHLLPLITKYLVEEKSIKEEWGVKGFSLPTWSASTQTLSALFDISSTVFSPSSAILGLFLNMEYHYLFVVILPHLLSLLPNLTALELYGTLETEVHIDLSLFQQADTSKLETLNIYGCSFDSLSPLSLCDLSSLHSLIIKKFPQRDGLHPLNGISSDITRSLKKLKVTFCNLKDISSLSDCDLSSLEDLNVGYNQSLTDISPLRGSNLSSLKSLSLRSTNISDLSPLSDCDLSSLESINLSTNQALSSLSPLRGSDLSSLKNLDFSGTNISDLSPLCECSKGLILNELNLRDTPFEDLSLLSLFDLSRLEGPIRLRSTKVSDLSPLENISYDGVEVNIYDTPAMKKMEEKRLSSPQTIGKVTVMWKL